MYLVLQGASGVPRKKVQGVIKISGGGVSKVNIATDLEIVFLGALDKEERFPTNEVIKELPKSDIKKI